MKRRGTILFGAIVFLVLVVGCAHSPRQFDPRFCDAECEAQRQADLEYLTTNFPTREQMLSVHECVTAETGYEYDELPTNYGPELLTKRNPEPTKIEEDMPFRLVERVLVAVGQRKPLRERVNGAREDCIYELGLEGRFYTPSSQERFRPRSSHVPTCDAECQAQMRADREYMAKNSPTREQRLQVRACATAKTGYDEFADLPPDDGPPSLTPGTPKPVHRIEEDMPFRLVERALVAVGQRKPLRERVYAALDECVFELGFEDNYILPRHQDTLRPRSS